MPLISTFVDNFNDNIIGPEWGNSYNGVTEVGGRARIPCVAGQYAGYQTAKVYTLTGSSVYVQLPVAAAANGATVEVQTVFSVTPDPLAGTNLAININTVANTIRFESNVGYTDGAAVSLTYSAATHAWLRIRETGGNILWDTSTDGSTWTNRRTLATPAWVTTAVDALAIDMWAYRNNGTTNYSEFDNLNTPASSASTYFAAGTATSDGTATGAATASAVVTANATADATADANTQLVAHAAGEATAEATGTSDTEGPDYNDANLKIGRPVTRWEAGPPWI